MSRITFGQLALFHTGKRLPLEVLQDPAGRHISAHDVTGPYHANRASTFAATPQSDAPSQEPVGRSSSRVERIGESVP